MIRSRTLCIATLSILLQTGCILATDFDSSAAESSPDVTTDVADTSTVADTGGGPDSGSDVATDAISDATGDTGGGSDVADTGSGGDSGQTDAGQIDAGQTDAGQTDAGQTDAGQTDAADACSGGCGTPGCPECPVDSISIEPSEFPLVIGGVRGLTAKAYDAQGDGVQCNFVWTSRDPSVATVDQTGHVTANLPGSTYIEASCDGVSGQSRAYVRPASARTLKVWLDAAHGVTYDRDRNVQTWEDRRAGLTSRPVYKPPKSAWSPLYKAAKSDLPKRVHFGAGQILRGSVQSSAELTVLAVVHRDTFRTMPQMDSRSLLSNCDSNTDGGAVLGVIDPESSPRFGLFGERMGPMNAKASATMSLKGPGELEVLGVIKDPTKGTITLFRNNTAKSVVPEDNPGEFPFRTIGGWCDPGSNFDDWRGSVVELLVFDTRLDSTTVDLLVQDYLMPKYGI